MQAFQADHRYQLIQVHADDCSTVIGNGHKRNVRCARNHLTAELQIVICQDLHQCTLAEAGEAHPVGRPAVVLDHSLKVAAQEVPSQAV